MAPADFKGGTMRPLSDSPSPSEDELFIVKAADGYLCAILKNTRRIILRVQKSLV